MHHYVRKLLKDNIFAKNYSSCLAACVDMTIEQLSKEDAKWCHMVPDKRKTYVARYWSLMKCVAALLRCRLPERKDTNQFVENLFNVHQTPDMGFVREDKSDTSSVPPNEDTSSFHGELT